ncbi:MAG TPA: hypothetical protein VMR31_07910 [Myxococcota bacterium]|nr:hypothetical protein [Myxococcota bacterium]
MAKKRKRGALYFTSIARAGDDSVALSGNYYIYEDGDEKRTALISLKQGHWGALDVSGIVHAARIIGTFPSGKWTMLGLTQSGGVYRASPSGVKFAMIDEERPGSLMDLRQIGGKWYAVGGHLRIHREDRAGHWTAIDDDVYLEDEKGNTKLLLSIDGTSGSDLWTVGYNGTVLHYDGSSWSSVESPTDYGLQRVLCPKKGVVYVCGYGNSLFRRNAKGGWDALTEPDEDIVFWDMAWFQDELYVCTKKDLFVLRDGELEKVKPKVDGPLGFYRMDADDGELWTCGNECVLRFDGKKWKQFVWPDNE